MKIKETLRILLTNTGKTNKTETSVSPTTNGVYFIVRDQDAGCNAYVKLTDKTAAAPKGTRYIGVKMGDRAIAVALKDLPGDSELRLLPRNHRSPYTSEHYSLDTEKQVDRFNVYEDFDGKGNTERLKAAGCEIQLPDREWIPSMGEIGLLMMNLSKVNKAIELAGGKPLKRFSWSSTEYSQLYAWLVHFSDGGTYFSSKCSSVAVRAVAAF